MSTSDAYNYRQVDDLISTSGILSEEQLQSLGREGFTAVINLLPDESKFAQKSERDIVTSQGLNYVYVPVDFAAPEIDDYRRFEQEMEALSGNKLMIHCAANYRVSAFFAVYANRKLGWTSTKSQAFISSIWNPDEYPPWNTFINQHLDSNDS